MQCDFNLQSVIDAFAFEGEFIDCVEIKVGHVNRTYRLDFRLPDGSKREYVLQNINTFAFKKPDELMENIRLVTDHLRQSMIARGEDPEDRVMQIIPVKGGGIMTLDAEGNCWRAYAYIRHSININRVDGPAEFYEIGRAFGQFQNMLADFPIQRLHDTIPDFHDTIKRLERFEDSVKSDATGRAGEVSEEIAFVRARAQAMGQIVRMIAADQLPLRVTHNDTKINNVMLDEDTGKALCVIDLDTVMAGSSLYDFGDAIRFGASTAAEDEADLSKVALDIELFEGFAEGFICETARDLTLAELENLPLGALVMTYEVGLRFLTDYLDGDVYFRIEYPNQNLVRARAQFKLLTDMEAKRDQMDRIVRRLIEKYR